MGISTILEHFQRLGFLSTASGNPDDYPREVNELVDIYQKALEYNFKNLLDAFKIEEEQDMIQTEIPRKQVKLKIRKSTISGAGLGIFAAERIPKGKIIGLYGGPLKELDTKNLAKEINLGEGPLSRTKYQEPPPFDEEQGNYAYTIPVDEEITNDYYVFPTEEQLKYHTKNVASFLENETPENAATILKNLNWTALMNDACDPYKNNVKVIENGFINTDKDIEKDEELFLEYGLEYWKNEKPYVTLDVFETINEYTETIELKIEELYENGFFIVCSGCGDKLVNNETIWKKHVQQKHQCNWCKLYFINTDELHLHMLVCNYTQQTARHNPNPDRESSPIVSLAPGVNPANLSFAQYSFTAKKPPPAAKEPPPAAKEPPPAAKKPPQAANLTNGYTLTSSPEPVAKKQCTYKETVYCSDTGTNFVRACCVLANPANYKKPSPSPSLAVAAPPLPSPAAAAPPLPSPPAASLPLPSPAAASPPLPSPTVDASTLFDFIPPSPDSADVLDLCGLFSSPPLLSPVVAAPPLPDSVFDDIPTFPELIAVPFLPTNAAQTIEILNNMEKDNLFFPGPGELVDIELPYFLGQTS